MNFAKRDLRITSLVLFALLLFGVAFGLLLKHPFVNFDDFALVDPLKNVHSISDYLTALKSNQIMDITPVRDLSYWLELEFESYTGFINHQLASFLIWIATIWIFSLVLLQLKIRIEIIALAILLIGLHPLIHSSVFWIAGRKHLLSAFFLMSSTLFFLKALRGGKPGFYIASWSLLFLSCFSQPIGIGFPIFVAAFLYAERKFTRGSIAYLISTLVLTATVALLNLTYYASESYANTGGLLAPKFQGESLDMIAKRFLVWGRDAFQILVPVRPAIGPYNLESMTSLIGLALILAVVILLVVEKKYFRKLSPWLVYLSLPIAVVTFKLTGQGGFDTYLISPLLGFGVLLSVWAEARALQLNRVIVSLASAAIVLFLIVNVSMANAWSDPVQLWETAVRTEDSKLARATYLRNLLNDQNVNATQVLELALAMKERDPENSSLGYNLGKAIYLQTLPLEEKHKLFEQHQLQDAWFDYYWSANDARQSLFERATNRLFERFNKDPRRFMISMSFSLPEVQSMWTKMCELAKRSDCGTIATLIENEKKRIESAKR